MATQVHPEPDSAPGQSRSIPESSSEQIAGSLHDEDLSGGQTIAPSDPLTTGRASLSKAYQGGFTIDPRSPQGRALIAAAKQKWGMHEDGRPFTAKEREQRAMTGSRQKLAALQKSGESAVRSVAQSYEAYHKAGGKYTWTQWCKKVVE